MASKTTGFGPITFTEGVRLPMRDFRVVMKNIETAPWEAFPVLAKHIFSWPFPGDPSDVEAYEDLELEEYTACMAAFAEHIAARSESKK